jgi:hypothetical protein
MRDNPHSTHTYDSTESKFFKEKSTMAEQSHIHHVDLFLTTTGRSHVHCVLSNKFLFDHVRSSTKYQYNK